MNKLLGKVEEGAKKLANHQVCFFFFVFGRCPGFVCSLFLVYVCFLFVFAGDDDYDSGKGAKKLANHQVCFLCSFSFFFSLVMLFMRLRRG